MEYRTNNGTLVQTTQSESIEEDNRQLHEFRVLRRVLTRHKSVAKLTRKGIGPILAGVEAFNFHKGEIVSPRVNPSNYFLIIGANSFFEVIDELNNVLFLVGPWTIVNDKMASQTQELRCFSEMGRLWGIPAELMSSTAQKSGYICNEAKEVLKNWSVLRFVDAELRKQLYNTVQIIDLEAGESRIVRNSLVFGVRGQVLVKPMKDLLRAKQEEFCISRTNTYSRNSNGGFTVRTNGLRQNSRVLHLDNDEDSITLESSRYHGVAEMIYRPRFAFVVSSIRKPARLLLMSRADVIETLGASVYSSVVNRILFNFTINQERQLLLMNDPTVQERLFKRMAIRNVPAGQTLLDGENATKNVVWFIVLEGCVQMRSIHSKESCTDDDIRLYQGATYGILFATEPIGQLVTAVEDSKVGMLSGLGVSNCVKDSLSNTGRLEMVQSFYLFKFLPRQTLEWISLQSQELVFLKGQKIIAEGDPGWSFYVIKEGEVVITKIVGGEEKTIRHLGKGDYFGERALLFVNEPRSASIAAHSERVACYEIVDKVFRAALLDEKKILDHFTHRMNLQDRRLFFDDLVVEKFIGEGSYGQVFKVSTNYIKKNTAGVREKMYYGCKMFKTHPIVKHGIALSLRREVEILAENDHPFLIKHVRNFKDEKFLYIITELLTGGELSQAIAKLMEQRPDGLTRYDIQFYLGSIISALQYLHSRGIVYRDLKPENMLLDEQGYLKVIDFGIAKKLDGQDGRTNTMIGTYHYMAPEIFLRTFYCLSVDLWSLGVVAYELATGETPWEPEECEEGEAPLKMIRRIINGKLFFPGEIINQKTGKKQPGAHVHCPQYRALIRGLLVKNPDTRLGCSNEAQGRNYKELIDHDFFFGFDYNRLLMRGLQVPYLPEGENFEINENLQMPLKDYMKSVKSKKCRKYPVCEDGKEWDYQFDKICAGSEN